MRWSAGSGGSQGAQELGRQEPAQVGGAGLQGLVELEARHAAFAELDLGVARIGSQKVRRQLVHAWLMADQRHGPRARVCLQRLQHFRRRATRLERFTADRLRPAGFLLEQLGGPPGAHPWATQDHVYRTYQRAQPASGLFEALLAGRRQRPLAIVRPLRIVGIEGHGVAHQVEVHAKGLQPDCAGTTMLGEAGKHEPAARCYHGFDNDYDWRAGAWGPASARGGVLGARTSGPRRHRPGARAPDPRGNAAYARRDSAVRRRLAASRG